MAKQKTLMVKLSMRRNHNHFLRKLKKKFKKWLMNANKLKKNSLPPLFQKVVRSLLKPNKGVKRLGKR